MARKLALAEAIVEVMGPGRMAARWRTSVILPVTAIKLLTKGGWGADDDGFQRLHRLAASFNGCIPRNFEVADHLDRAGAGLWLPGRLAGQHGTRSAFGIDGVALAFLMSQLAVGTIDLQDNGGRVQSRSGTDRRRRSQCPRFRLPERCPAKVAQVSRA